MSLNEKEVEKIQKESKTEILKDLINFVESSVDKENAPAKFDIDNYIKGTVNQQRKNNSRVYTQETIQRLLLNPSNPSNELNIRKASNYFYNNYQEYANTVDFMANLPLYYGIVYPLTQYKNTKQYQNVFFETLSFVENYGFQNKFYQITKTLVKEDLWFGYEREESDTYVFQKFDSDYCRILGTDGFGCYTFEFDLSFFDKEKHTDVNNYPREIKTAYANYKNKKQTQWYKVNPRFGICFKFNSELDYGKPNFTGIFTNLLGIDEYQAEQLKSQKQKNSKIISQKIPLKDNKDNKRPDDFALSGKYVTGSHNNLSQVVDEDTGVITSAMEIKVHSISENKIEEDIVSKSLRNLFTSSGVPQSLFTTESSVGLRESIKNVSQKIFNLNRQYELWINKRLKNLAKESKKKDIFAYKFLDITIYNQQEKFDIFLKGGQFGFPKMYAPICLGISQLELMNILALENGMNIIDMLKPLASSHTTSLKPTSEKSQDDLQDSGLKTREREDNEAKIV